MKKADWMLLLGTNLMTAVLCWALFSKNESTPGPEALAGVGGPMVIPREEAARAGDDDSPAKGKVANRPRAAEANEEDDEVRDGGSSRPMANQVSDGGALVSGVMSKYGLTRGQYDRMQAELSKYWAAMARSTAERISYDAVASEGSPDDAEVYRLPAMAKEEREELSRELADSLREIGGAKASREITGGLSSSNSFGYHGKYDMVFRFKPMEVREMDAAGNVIRTSIDKSQMMVSYQMTDPETGSVDVEGRTTSGELANSYGNIFVVPVGGGAGK